MRYFKYGDVVIIDLPYKKGSHVQGGKRPWVIVQNDVGNRTSSTTIVAPITSKIKRLDIPTHVPFVWDNLQPGMIECEQVRVIDINPRWKYIAHLPLPIMRHVDRALKAAYGGGYKK